MSSMADAEYEIRQCTVCNKIFSRITLGKWSGFRNINGYWIRYFVTEEGIRLDKKGNYKNPLAGVCDVCRKEGIKEVDNR